MKAQLPVLAATAALIALAAGCSGEGGTAFRAPCPAGQICLEYGNTAEPLTLDPHYYTGAWESAIIGELVVGLTDTDAAGNTVPGMATHWEASADGLTWTFHLRDAVWSDGVPVTADDFVFGLHRLMNPENAAGHASQYYWIKNAQPVNAGEMPSTALGIRAVDPKTVEIALEYPWAILPDYAAGPAMAPVPRHVVERLGDQWIQPGNFVGNGPYNLVRWSLGDRITIEKNPTFYEAEQVCVDRISYYPTTDTVSAERRVRSGELDINTNIVSNRVARLMEPDQMPEYVRVHPYVGIVFLTFNTTDVPALGDRRVRQAISMSIDREFITDGLLRGGHEPASTYVPFGMYDYDNPVRFYWADWSLERRQAEARRLLAEAGYGPERPLRLEIKHRNSADPVLFLPAIQADLKEVGVRIDLVMNETQVAYAAYDAKDFQIGDAGWVGGADAYGYLYLHRVDTGSQNNSGYANARYDALLDAANNEPDVERRKAMLGEAERMLLEDMPIAPLYYPSSRNLVNPNITGWEDNVFNTHKARYLCVADAEARRAGASG